MGRKESGISGISRVCQVFPRKIHDNLGFGSRKIPSTESPEGSWPLN